MCSPQRETANEPHLASRSRSLRALKVHVAREACICALGPRRQQLKSAFCSDYTAQIAERTASCLSHSKGGFDCVAGHVAAGAELIQAHCEAGS